VQETYGVGSLIVKTIYIVFGSSYQRSVNLFQTLLSVLEEINKAQALSITTMIFVVPCQFPELR
jgi:hypothetical protein